MKSSIETPKKRRVWTHNLKKGGIKDVKIDTCAICRNSFYDYCLGKNL